MRDVQERKTASAKLSITRKLQPFPGPPMNFVFDDHIFPLQFDPFCESRTLVCFDFIRWFRVSLEHERTSAIKINSHR